MLSFRRSGFTLIELLVIMGILAVLATATALVINPAQLLAQARDSKRLTDIDKVNKALDHYQLNLGQPVQQTNTVYASLPDVSPTCSSYVGLPQLASGWSYSCAPTSSYRNTDGTGWVPVDFSNITQASFEKLPIDPKNTASYFYTYIPGRLLTVGMESSKYLRDIAAMDGGVDPGRYELGNSSLWNEVGGPAGHWAFDEDSGSVAIDSSSNGNNGMLLNGPTRVDGKLGRALQFSGSNVINDHVDLGNPLALQITGSQTIMMWLKPNNLSLRRNPYAKAYGGEGTITIEIGGSRSYYYGTGGGNVTPYQGFGGSSIPNNEWTHITLVRNLTNMRLYWYKNGVQSNSTPATYSPATASSLNALIGKGYTNIFAGIIDEVRIYNRALSATEVLSIYNAQK